ncbi:MAG: glycoside hydrolase family 97 N-terminal domain-containing protein [Ginsengibacter sp.]
MHYLNNILFAFLIAISIPVFAQENIGLTSPDGRIVFIFKLTDSLPVYSVAFKDKTIIEPSTLSLSFDENGDFGSGLKINKAIFRNGEDNYSLIVGKTKNVHDQYREVTIPLQELGGSKRLINLIVRAFNDGLAFRYEIPQQKNWTSYVLTSENATFHLAGDPQVLAGYLPNYTTISRSPPRTDAT